MGPLRVSRGLGPSDVSVPLGLSWTILFPLWALLGSLWVSGSKPLWSNALFILPNEPARACPSAPGLSFPSSGPHFLRTAHLHAHHGSRTHMPPHARLHVHTQHA